MTRVSFPQLVFTVPVQSAVAWSAVLQPVAGAYSKRRLTLRETQILECVADGLGNKQIAGKLDLGDETVKSHVRNIYEKLGAADRANAVAIALRRKIIL